LRRAYCSHCKQFSVVPNGRHCAICGKPLARGFRFVDVPLSGQGDRGATAAIPRG